MNAAIAMINVNIRMVEDFMSVERGRSWADLQLQSQRFCVRFCRIRVSLRIFGMASH
jgi:hypothetical protein